MQGRIFSQFSKFLLLPQYSVPAPLRHSPSESLRRGNKMRTSDSVAKKGMAPTPACAQFLIICSELGVEPLRKNKPDCSTLCRSAV